MTNNPGFKETFIEVGQEYLNKNRNDKDLIMSVAPIVTGLMVIAALVYALSPIASIVALVVALVALWGRWVLTRQLRGDLHDMYAAKQAHAEGRQPAECAAFVQARATQILLDNKMLTAAAKKQVQELQSWATQVS